jgi:hypothetical protein
MTEVILEVFHLPERERERESYSQPDLAKSFTRMIITLVAFKRILKY